MNCYSDDEFILREVVYDDAAPAEQLQEGAAEVAGVMGAVFGGGSFVLQAASYMRDRPIESQRDERRDEMATMRRAIHEERRQLAFEEGGFAGLDELDSGHYFDHFGDSGGY